MLIRDFMEIKRSQIAKEAAGKAAAELVENEMLVGLGTGSTAACFIDFLSHRCRQGLKIKAVATSQTSWNQAAASGIPMIDINTVTSLDLTIDGADEIDPFKRMIKGGGGALLREKVVAFMSREMVVIIDESKQVEHLGAHPLPVEIIPFAFQATLHHLEQLGYKGSLRKTSNGELFITENKNYIFDLHFPQLLEDPEFHDRTIRKIPGIVETGFFFNLAGRVIVGLSDGNIQIKC